MVQSLSHPVAWRHPTVGIRARDVGLQMVVLGLELLQAVLHQSPRPRYDQGTWRSHRPARHSDRAAVRQIQTVRRLAVAIGTALDPNAFLSEPRHAQRTSDCCDLHPPCAFDSVRIGGGVDREVDASIGAFRQGRFDNRRLGPRGRSLSVRRWIGRVVILETGCPAIRDQSAAIAVLEACPAGLNPDPDRIGQIAILEIGALHGRVDEAGAAEQRILKVHPLENRVAKIRAFEIDVIELDPLQNGATEVRALEVSIDEFHPFQMVTREVVAPEIHTDEFVAAYRAISGEEVIVIAPGPTTLPDPNTLSPPGLARFDANPRGGDPVSIDRHTRR